MADQDKGTTESVIPTTSEEKAKTPGTTQTGNSNEVTQTPTTTEEQKTTDPQVDAAMKLLAERGLLGREVLTKKQFDGHMGAARKQWEKEAGDQATAAAQEADRKAKEEQGEFKPLYEAEKGRATQLETDLADAYKELDQRITEMVREWPALALEDDPGAGNPEKYKERLAWYSATRKYAEALKSSAGNTGGTGWTPGGNNNNGAKDPVDAVLGAKYNQPKK